MGVGDPCHRIRHARASGHHGHTQLTRELAVRVRHINCSALITYVDNAYAFGIALHPHRHDVTTTQGKNTIHTACFQKAGNDASGHVGMEFRRLHHLYSVISSPSLAWFAFAVFSGDASRSRRPAVVDLCLAGKYESSALLLKSPWAGCPQTKSSPAP